jgi:hypothetical protein
MPHRMLHSRQQTILSPFSVLYVYGDADVAHLNQVSQPEFRLANSATTVITYGDSALHNLTLSPKLMTMNEIGPKQ